MAARATNDFQRFHHLRSGLFFAISTVEAFLNQKMREHMVALGASEDEIFNKLRKGKIWDKIKKWPSDICGEEVWFSDNAISVIEKHKDIRDEITHPKKRDHSIYIDLAGVSLKGAVDAASEVIVTICSKLGRPFPYWVLGWNYVGMNGDPSFPCLLNNINGFVHSVKNMGFTIPNLTYDWDKRNMVSLEDFRALKLALDQYPSPIEPFYPAFPQRPRLTREWWNREVTLACETIPDVQESALPFD